MRCSVGNYHMKSHKLMESTIILLLDRVGETIIGNARIVPPRRLSQFGMRELQVWRDGRQIVGRVQALELSNGNFLVVGSDMQAQRDIEDLFARASGIVTVFALLLAVIGAITFRRVVDMRAADIRTTMARVAAGDLAQRIPVPAGHKDEFALLGRDINSMLERLQQLMDGVRHVSNTIAHNLRTPMTRILLRLRAAENADPAEQRETLRLVANEVAELGQVFDKLLAIAEVESGALRQAFTAVDVAALLEDMYELYEPLVQEQGGSIQLQVQGRPQALGDRNLLASALANLVENAIKYGSQAGQGVHMVLEASEAGDVDVADLGSDAPQTAITVRDLGPGVAQADLAQLAQRFFRAHQEQPGTGLGLASVSAVVRLHGGQLRFRNGHPGFEVQMHLPAVPAKAL